MGDRLPLSAAQRELLLTVNDWLRRTDGGNVAVVAAAERAYELIRDEKAFDSTPPSGGAKLWGAGKLTFQLLRCERISSTKLPPGYRAYRCNWQPSPN